MHFSKSTEGFPERCCSIFPALLPQPIPIFFKAPPNPAASCPLKWFKDMNTSASIIALPILAFFTYSPPSTGTSTSSVPFSPSAIITWQPVENGLNPFSYAASKWSNAFFLCPTYNVLQSVKNGFPPNSFTTSTTVFA